MKESLEFQMISSYMAKMMKNVTKTVQVYEGSQRIRTGTQQIGVYDHIMDNVIHSL